MKVDRPPCRGSTTTPSSTGDATGSRITTRFSRTGTSTSRRTTVLPVREDGDRHAGRDPDRRSAGREEALEAATSSPRIRRSTCSRSSVPRRRRSSARSSSTQARCTARADDEDRLWVLRVMAEELRHGYQMFHLLLTEDWTHVSGGVKGETMVEEILSMQTGSHVLDAFNLEYDSFIDNICFAALDRPRRQVPAHDAEGVRVQADGRLDAADATRGGVPPRGRRDPDAPLGAARGEGRQFVTCRDPEVDQQVVPARRSRCSATSAAATRTSSSASRT